VSVELSVFDAGSHEGLLGSGCLVLNAPWIFKAEVEQWLSKLWHRLSISKQGKYDIQAF